MPIPRIKNLVASQLLQNIFSGIGLSVINIGTILVAYPVYLNYLGYERYGIWLILATLLSFAQIGKLGINEAVIKLIAEEKETGNKQAVEEYSATALTLILLLGILIFVIIVLLHNPIWKWLNLPPINSVHATWLVIGVAFVSVYAFIAQTMNALLSGLGRMDLANYGMAAGRISGIVTSVGCLLAGLDIFSLLIGNLMNFATIHFAAQYQLKKYRDFRLFNPMAFRPNRIRQIIAQGLPIFGTRIIQILLNPFNKIMLTHFGTISDVPIYEIAYNGTMQIRNVAETGLRALLPEFARLNAKEKLTQEQSLKKLYKKTVKYVSLVSLPLYLCLFLFTEPLLSFWLGNMFRPIGTPIFQIMLVGIYFSLVAVPAWYYFMGQGHPIICFKYSIAISAINVLFVATSAFLWSTVTLYQVVIGMSSGMLVAFFYFIFKMKSEFQKGA